MSYIMLETFPSAIGAAVAGEGLLTGIIWSLVRKWILRLLAVIWLRITLRANIATVLG